MPALLLDSLLLQLALQILVVLVQKVYRLPMIWRLTDKNFIYQIPAIIVYLNIIKFLLYRMFQQILSQDNPILVLVLQILGGWEMMYYPVFEIGRAHV